MQPQQKNAGFTLLELLLVLGIVFVCMTLIVPAIHHARQQSRNNMCKNNLKQIAIALHNYHDVHRTFPPGWVARHWESGSGPGYGWQAFLLPYLEHALLYSDLNFDRVNLDDESVNVSVKFLRCPSDPTPERNPVRSGLPTSNYSGNFGDQPAPRLGFGRRTQLWAGNAATPQQTSGIFCGNSSVRIARVTDGLSNTILIGERGFRSGSGIWPGVGDNSFESDQVTDTSGYNPPNGSSNSFSGSHQVRGEAGVFVGICDGSVRFISQKIDSSQNGQRPGVWQLLGNREDGQAIPEY